jgi:alkylation response protein AidB-like acyl-CoA dehydrogenase
VTTQDIDTGENAESIDSFRQRARTWITGNLRNIGPSAPTLRAGRSDEEELAEVANDRRLQRQLFDAGFAGMCFPREFGGQGLSPEHQKAFNEELAGYEYPLRVQCPTFTPCAAVINDFGTDEQKRHHLPAIFRGEEIWMQFLSEPSAGSDLAGVLTTAVRDGDEWVLNGSKIWTTGAWWSDWGLCLARTNWDVPKHRGLTVFMLPIKQPSIEVHRIEMLNGNKEFCQEFLSDVRVPDSDRVGDVDDGWTVVTRWMFHERMLYNSPFVTVPVGSTAHAEGNLSMSAIAREAGRLDDPSARALIGEAQALELVGEALKRRITNGIVRRVINDQSSAVVRLFHGHAATRRTDIAFELAGAAGAAWTDDDAALEGRGNDFLMRQVSCIGGGTTEMARNVISERVLGMPRERNVDRDIAFSQVPRGRRADDK